MLILYIDYVTSEYFVAADVYIASFNFIYFNSLAKQYLNQLITKLIFIIILSEFCPYTSYFYF